MFERSLNNGIEFYVSTDGSVAGCSRPGIAALCGVPRETMRDFIEAKGGEKSILKSLKALLDEPFYPAIIGTNGAKILTEELCIAFVISITDK